MDESGVRTDGTSRAGVLFTSMSYFTVSRLKMYSLPISNLPQKFGKVLGLRPKNWSDLELEFLCFKIFVKITLATDTKRKSLLLVQVACFN